MGKINILIADDFDILTEDLRELITAQIDMEVIATAKWGTEIVTLAQTHPFDIILMDIEMEHTTAGIEATRKIRDIYPEAKIIFLTAHATDDIILQAMATGAVDYIVKGTPADELLEHIRSAYKGKSLLANDVKEIVMKEYSRLRETEEHLIEFITTVSKLTTAEREIIRLLLQNKKLKEIAAIRSVELVTVKTQISGLLKKFNEKRTKAIVKKINELNLATLFEEID